jgi:hypothetical protein
MHESLPQETLFKIREERVRRVVCEAHINQLGNIRSLSKTHGSVMYDVWKYLVHSTC